MSRIEREQNPNKRSLFESQIAVGILAATLLSETIIKALRGQEISIIDGRYKERKILPKLDKESKSATVRSESAGVIKIGHKEVLVFDNTKQPTPTGVVVHIGKNTVVTSRGKFFMKSGRTRYIDRGTTYIDSEGIEVTHIEE